MPKSPATHLLRGLVLGLGLALATAPALAKAPHGEPHPTEQAHGGEHATASTHGGGHGSHYYTADDDGDGTPNWLDGDSELYVVTDLGFHAFNLFCLVLIIWWLGRKPVGDAIRERALAIRKELTDTARARDEAYQRHQELVARLDKIEGEMEAMESEAREEAAKEERKLIERAEAEAKRIAETAERNIRDEASRARNALRRDAIEIAAKLAEGILARNVTPADQQALARDFLASLNDDAHPRA